MQPIIYDVAVSIDGYIAAPGDDISAFPMQGPQVDAYQQRLASYSTVLLGRRTYEFGYAYGLKPGAKAYPHMDHYVFSASIDLPEGSEVVKVAADWRATIDRLRAEDGPGIYLCGGGALAGFLADIHRIDLLRLKRIPAVLGGGTRLFGASHRRIDALVTGLQDYGNGVILQEFRLLHPEAVPGSPLS